MKRRTRPGKPVTLCDSLNRKLNGYAVAASAAGLGALALAQPAEAKIIYTPAHETLHNSDPFHLDLNHDGINDFLFSLRYFSLTNSLEVAGARKGNETWFTIGRYGYACVVPAPRGALVGAYARFASGGEMFLWEAGLSFCRWGSTQA